VEHADPLDQKRAIEVRLLELREARERGELVPAGWAAEQLAARLERVRSRLLAIPAHHPEPLRSTLRAQVLEALGALAEFRADESDELTPAAGPELFEGEDFLA
jgi:hypothetical protein